jgi:hypothetical protein
MAGACGANRLERAEVGVFDMVGEQFCRAAPIMRTDADDARERPKPNHGDEKQCEHE